VSEALATAHRTHARAVWAVAYRMLGSAADADEVLQDTFVRALEAKPRASAEAPLAPWLFKVATRLSIDRLRSRRAQGYQGPWLPSPVATEELEVPTPPTARYDVLESASVAFLLALEVLSPEQRAVVVLRDVFDWSAAEVAACLDLSDANVRQLHHRARALLSDDDTRRLTPVPAQRQRHKDMLEQFFAALATGDAAAARALLADDVRAITDGGGVYHAAMVPVVGPERVLTFFTRLMQLRGLPTEYALRELNGLWAIDASFESHSPKDAPRSITGVLLDAQGRIAVLTSVMAPAKLERRAPPRG
jgi:RNA polymerase sigma-70 factor (ECF subfamily)